MLGINAAQIAARLGGLFQKALEKICCSSDISSNRGIKLQLDVINIPPTAMMNHDQKREFQKFQATQPSCSSLITHSTQIHKDPDQ
jgi:hypothetical protein